LLFQLQRHCFNNILILSTFNLLQSCFSNIIATALTLYWMYSWVFAGLMQYWLWNGNFHYVIILDVLLFFSLSLSWYNAETYLLQYCKIVSLFFVILVLFLWFLHIIISCRLGWTEKFELQLNAFSVSVFGFEFDENNRILKCKCKNRLKSQFFLNVNLDSFYKVA